MKTEPERDRVSRLSRRAFVIGAGTAVTASTMGTAAGDDGDRSLTVEAASPYVPTIEELANAFEREAAGVPVEVTQAGARPTERVLEGPADVFISGNPLSTGETADTGLRRGIAVHGWATLATRSDDWRESLRAGSLNERMADEMPVETWSESDWASVEHLDSGDGESSDEQCAGLVDEGGEKTALVRGTRAYQYARGQGGVGYYEVDPDDVGAPSNARTRGDGVVPLVRLGHVYASESSLAHRPTGPFLRFYRQRVPGIDAVSLPDDFGLDSFPDLGWR